MQTIRALIIISMLSILAGCGSSSPETNDPVIRSIELWTYDTDGVRTPVAIEEQAPLTIYCIPAINLLPEDSTGPGSVTSVEVDPGDGSGWLDMTDEWRDFVAALAVGSVMDISDYIEIEYTMQGQFEMQARVTFTDGEICTTADVTGDLLQPKIQVLPYDEETTVFFNDPFDGSHCEVTDGQVFIYFVDTLAEDAITQFISDMELRIVTHEWGSNCYRVAIPAQYSVRDAMIEWPDDYPEIIESVDMVSRSLVLLST